MGNQTESKPQKVLDGCTIERTESGFSLYVAKDGTVLATVGLSHEEATHMANFILRHEDDML